jgi:predicted secreted hydrolase
MLPGARPAPSPKALPAVRFPQDEAPHTNLTEWWYYTGHLQARDAQERQRDYGFELTFFQTLRGQLLPYYAAHFAISDISRGQFHYDERAGFEPSAAIPPAGSTQGFNLALGGWALQGVNGHDKLNAAMTDYSFALGAVDQLPHPALHGGNGIISFGTAGFSYYYSRPLLAVSGTLTDHGAKLQATGTAWMDHQWGNFISVNGAGWEWFSIQLADHTEYMLYDIRDAQNKPTALVGTAVSADGTVRQIPSSAISIEQLGTWTSPHTNGVYPSGWRVTLKLPGVALTLTPQLRDQELVTAKSTGVAYWEGAVSIAGRSSGRPVTGVGYVELTGYASISSSAQGSPLP